MYITIAGGGRIGRGLAKRLVADKHDVVIIDREKSVCEAIYAEFGAVTINGNATSLEVLEHAGIEKSDIAVSVMRNDADNLTFALLARHFQIPHIHVRMNDPKYESVYKSVGVTNIARVTSLLIEQFLVNIETPELRKVIGLGNLEIVIVNVHEACKLNGTAVNELTSVKGFPDEITIVCIFEDETETLSPVRGDSVIHSKDRLYLCGSRKDIKSVTRLLGS
jgi:trk system potassium uptake protein